MSTDFVLGRTPLLPVEAYLSEEWFAREQELIFAPSWICIGVESDAAEPGDYLTAQVGRYGIFVVRGDDRRLRAFHNVCRHRGTQLLRATGSSQTGIVCPYHNWTYSINGDLVSIPQPECFPGLRLEERGLHAASVETWNGLLFVHPEPDPPQNLREWLGGFPDKFGPHRPALLTEVEPDVHEWDANWKIVVENYIDGYHLMHLHATTLDQYDHLAAQTGFLGRHFHFWEPPTPEYRKWLERNGAWRLAHLSAEDDGAYVHMLWPATGLVGLEFAWSLFQVIPLSATRTRIEVRNWSDGGGGGWSRLLSVLGGGGKGKDGSDPLASGDFMQEDRYVCEQQQRAMRSPLFGVGASAERYEDSVRGFQRNVADAMGVSVDA